jgi:hypothetical protein
MVRGILPIAMALVLLAVGCGGPEGVTVEQFNHMNDKNRSALLSCQLDKYSKQVGQKQAMDCATRSSLKDIKDGGVTPLQVDLIRDKGVSCTRGEISKYYG